ncbi:unnamed protein product [Clonostachys chloroleuca]|uniref:Uncharacterized protein n=1 Tax=Clonostachys chloroleuca TaxID=1926264 RepID=A0AA35LPW8_9HYPO|nr:unnamed protein product [Clonostachys chloroleuca]
MNGSEAGPERAKGQASRDGPWEEPNAERMDVSWIMDGHAAAVQPSKGRDDDNGACQGWHGLE